MKKLKSLKDFQSNEGVKKIDLTNNLVMGGGTHYIVGECTNGGTDCQNWGYSDNGEKIARVGLPVDNC